MKFWKIGLFTVLVFFSAVFIIVHSSCDKNVCDNVTCFNGGSCNMGVCHCPVGYEDPQCQMVSRTRYIGVYRGYTECNNGAELLDSVWITAASNILYVDVAIKSQLPKVLHGYVSNNQATYSIIVPNDSALHYLKGYTITLQGDKLLTINTWEHDNRVTGDTIFNSCYFNGSLQK